jgi:hypothetical protein
LQRCFAGIERQNPKLRIISIDDPVDPMLGKHEGTGTGTNTTLSLTDYQPVNPVKLPCLLFPLPGLWSHAQFD